MFKKLILAGMVTTAVALTGCSSGGSGNDSSPSRTDGQVAAVAGPLDQAQTGATTAVFDPLESATAGTPLQGVLACSDAAINQNLTDAADALINGLQNPSAIAATTAPEIQAQLAAFAQNVSGLLTALASSTGSATCSTAGSTGGASGTNPLAGTPLATFGAAVQQAIQQFQSGLASAGASGSAGTGGDSGVSPLQAFANLYAAFNTQLQAALLKVPASAMSAPIIGGTLMTFQQLTPEFGALLDAAAANDPDAFNAATQTYANDFIVDYLTLIVPTAYLEDQAGQQGKFTGPIDQAAAQSAAAFVAALGSLTPQYLNFLNNPTLAQFFAPGSEFLQILTQAISGAGSTGSSGTGTGTGGSSSGPTGTPLDAILTPLISALQGLKGSGVGTGSCAFASFPLLSKLCPAT